MSLAGIMFCHDAGKNDKKRDAKLKPTPGVKAIRDIDYAGSGDKWNLLDVYYPEGTRDKLPTIVSIHGGGYVYGSKEIYKFYGMYVASLGFTFVNFNYHLAPRHKFPTQLTETNRVMEWCVENAEEYHMDMNNVFMVGDSAGAQMLSHYAAIHTNPEFEELFDFKTPKAVRLRAIGLNCGIYEIDLDEAMSFMKGLHRDYLGRNPKKWGDLISPLKYITDKYPPAYIMTASHDFLKDNAKPMCELLQSKGVEAVYKCYGTEADTHMEHVCHVNMNLEEAKLINQEETAFFRKFIKEGPDTVKLGDMVLLSCRSENLKFNREAIPVNVGKGLFNKEVEELIIGMKLDERKVLAIDSQAVSVKVVSISRKDS